MRKLICSLFAGLILCAPPAQAGLISLVFDDDPNEILAGPFVGSGTVSWTGPVVDGTFAVLSLPDFDVFFDFGGDTFTLADAVTPLSEVEVIISGGGTSLYFSNTGATSGPFGGAIDFINLANAIETVLSFEPPGNSAPPPSLYFTDSFFGDYGTVPEPTSFAVFGLGACCLLGFLRRSRGLAA